MTCGRDGRQELQEERELRRKEAEELQAQLDVQHQARGDGGCLVKHHPCRPPRRRREGVRDWTKSCERLFSRVFRGFLLIFGALLLFGAVLRLDEHPNPRFWMEFDDSVSAWLGAGC